MRNSQIRLLVVLAVVSLIGIVGTQLYWLDQAVKQQDQVFNHNVHVALRNVVESLCDARGKDFPVVNPIEKVSNNYYIVRSNDQIDLENLEYLITAEIQKRSITQQFEYGVYDCQNDQMVFSDNVSLVGEKSTSKLPILADEEYYFGVYFPEKSQALIAGIDLWKLTTALTIVITLLFGYALFVILKQKRLSEIQKDFINNVTHELKTPLSTLTLATETLKAKSSSADQKYLQIIGSEVDRLRNNVSSILHAAMHEYGQEVNMQSVDMHAFLERLREKYGIQYAHSQKRLTVDLSPLSKIQSDKGLLEKSLDNLVENAYKYGGNHILLKGWQDDRFIFLEVSDDGAGIPVKYRKFLFHKFFRVPEEQNRHAVKGFGLGLYIVKRSMEKLGATVQLKSDESSGTVFTLKIKHG